MLWVCLVGRRHLQRYAAVKSTLILLSASLNTTRTGASEGKGYFIFIRKKDRDFSSLCVDVVKILIYISMCVWCLAFVGPFLCFSKLTSIQ